MAILDRASDRAVGGGGGISADQGSSRSQRRAFGIGVLILSLFYVAGFVDRGWLPHDEGTLGQSAERALHGELPHRDFDDYTGGLTWIHALAFRLGGIRLLTIRWVLFLFVLPFVWAVYSIASRLAPPLSAAAITLLSVAWSVPNYFASLPSWYNLFFATFGVLCLLRYLESNRRFWLLAAGLCAGISMLMKIVGLYDVAAVLLFLVYREQVLTTESSTPDRPRLFFLFKAGSCALFLALLFSLVHTRLDPMHVFHFVLPSLAVTIVLLGFEWKEGRGATPQRFRNLFRLLVPFGIGVALPLVLFLIPYFLTESLKNLYRGVFLLPQVQIRNARLGFPPASSLATAIPYTILLAFPAIVPRGRIRWFALGLSVLLAIALLSSSAIPVYEAIWNSARSLDGVAAIVGCVFLARRKSELPSIRRQQLFLLISVCALVGLVQFPFAAPIYFCYVAPLVALAIFALVSVDSRAPKWIHACILGFYLVFGMVRLNSKYCVIFWDYQPDTLLDLKRGGLRVEAAEANAYSALVHLIQETQAGRRLWAGPDCPEVYFLAARPNPTRFFFDFLGGFSGNNAALERMLEKKRITMVVLNRAPHFSAKPTAELYQSLAARFPHSQSIWKFIVMWKD